MNDFLFPPPSTDYPEDKSIPCSLQGENECTTTFLLAVDEQGRTVIHSIEQKGKSEYGFPCVKSDLKTPAG